MRISANELTAESVVIDDVPASATFREAQFNEAIEMAKTGTTCTCEMAQVSPWPTEEALDAVAQAYADVGLRASIAAQAFDLPQEGISIENVERDFVGVLTAEERETATAVVPGSGAAAR